MKIRHFLSPVTSGLLLLAVFLVSSASAATIPVPAGSNLGTYLAAAQCGDTLVLEANATFVGNYVLVQPGGVCAGTDADYVTVTTSGILPAAGTRLDPTVSGAQLAKLVSPNNYPVISTRPSAKRWKFIGLDITSSTGTFVPSQITLGISSITGETPTWAQRLLQVGWVFDRCFIHDPSITSSSLISTDTTHWTERGIQTNVPYVTIMNSYIAGYTGYDSGHAVLASEDILMDGGPGPLAITNNYLEANYSSVFIGGSDAAPDPNHQASVSNASVIGSATLSNVTGLSVNDLIAFKVGVLNIWSVGQVTGIVGNDITYTALSASGQPFFTAPLMPGLAQWNGYQISNVSIFTNTITKRSNWDSSFGLPKNFMEVKMGNLVDIEGNSFSSPAQATNFAFTLRNQNGTSPWVTINNLTFKNNLVQNLKAGPIFGTIMFDDEKVTNDSSTSWTIQNNLIYNADSASDVLFAQGGNNVTFNHNTIINSHGVSASTYPLTSLALNNSIFYAGSTQYGCSYGSPCYPSHSDLDNLIVNNASVAGLAAIFPGSLIAANTAAVQFTDAPGGNYRLQVTSPGHNAASDGSDIGVNQNALEAALAATPTVGATLTPTPTATPTSTFAPGTPTPTNTPTATPTVAGDACPQP